MSPSFDFGSSGTAGTSSSMTSTTSPLSSSSSNPKSVISRSSIPSSSISSFSRSHVASSAVLLSASRKALICCSVKSSAIMQGTDSSPSFFAAACLVCPATITPSLSIIIGFLKPNSFIDAATKSTAASLFRGLLTYGISSSTFFSIIFTLSSP